LANNIVHWNEVHPRLRIVFSPIIIDQNIENYVLNDVLDELRKKAALLSVNNCLKLAQG
jgi:hypothetical protein